jgi:hypothetical protein
MTGFLSRLAPRRTAEDQPVAPAAVAEPEVVVSTKALKKFIASLQSRPSPVLLDLGPVVGSNIAFFGEHLGCKIFIEDVFADLDRFQREHRPADLPSYLETRFPQEPESVDGVLCWDLFDFLDKASSRVVAGHLMRVLRAHGSLLGFFATSHPSEAPFTKFIVADDSNLRHRAYSALRMRQPVMQNRDIIKLFERLRVSDSFLLQSKVREILFRKPDYLANP